MFLRQRETAKEKSGVSSCNGLADFGPVVY